MTETEAYKLYDEFLDCEGPVQVAGFYFDASRILKELDPTAYDCGFADWVWDEDVEWDE
jgi:hypothetical protein